MGEREDDKPAYQDAARGSHALSKPGDDEPQEPGPRLRERAENLLASGGSQVLAEQPEERDVARLVHELQVHQVELEMQNEELRRAQIELAASAERYSDLYDFAPVGYLSMSIDGLVTRANLTAAALLGLERRALLGRSLHRFVQGSHQQHLYSLRRRLAAPELSESAELVLTPAEGEPFWAQLEIVTRLDPVEQVLLWQVAISNIDAQKRAEQALQQINEELETQVERRTGQLTLTNRQLAEEIMARQEAEAELREREAMLERRVAERTAELAALLAIAREISLTLDIDDLLQIMLSELRSIVPYDGCGLFLLSGTVLTLVAYDGPLKREEILQSQLTLDDSPLLRGVLERRGPLIVADMLADTPWTVLWRDHASALQRRLLNKSRCWMGVPMIAQGQPIGVLRLDHAQPGYFTEQHADLVLTLASQAAIAVVNARLYSQALRLAAVEERQRLARELHDTVAQTFYSIALAAHSARARIGQEDGVVERRVDHVLELAEAGLTEMKALIFDLHAEGIRREGLVHALRQHVDAITARNDIRVRAELGEEPRVSLESKEAIYGIAREALQNVVRHANATELSLKLSREDDLLCLELRDNGRGFVADQVGAHTFGLRSMRERAKAAGGNVEITSTPGEGVLVRAQIPFKAG